MHLGIVKMLLLLILLFFSFPAFSSFIDSESCNKDKKCNSFVEDKKIIGENFGCDYTFCVKVEYIGENSYIIVVNSKLFVFTENLDVKVDLEMRKIVGIHSISSQYKNLERFGVIVGFVDGGMFRTIQVETKKEKELDLVEILRKESFGMLSTNPSGRKVLVLINPVSGAKRSVYIFQNKIERIFEFAHLEFESIVTEYMGHAEEIVSKLNTTKFNEIVSVGGDGLVYEIVNGLFKHKNMQYTEIKKIYIGIIPTGTGNGLSWSLGTNCDPVQAALIVARGKTVSHDVMSIITPSKKINSFLFFSYGMVGDVDFGYKPLKFLGDLKYIIGGLVSCFTRTSYPFEMYYVQYKDEIQTPLDEFKYPDSLENAFLKKKEIDLLENENQKLEPNLYFLERHFKKDLDEMLKNHGDVHLNFESFSGNGRETVVKKVTDDESMTVYVSNTRKFSYDLWSSANISHGNGYIDLLWLKNENLGIIDTFKHFFQLMQSDAKYLEADILETRRIKAFYFIPNMEKQSIIDIDGEEKPNEAMMGMVHQGLLSFFHSEFTWN